jgi:hypothetical protein
MNGGDGELKKTPKAKKEDVKEIKNYFRELWLQGMPKEALIERFNEADRLARAAKNARKRGGSAGKKKTGIILAALEAYRKSKDKTARGLWQYLKKKHMGEKRAFRSGDYTVYFEIDKTGGGKDRLMHSRGLDPEKWIYYTTFRLHYFPKKLVVGQFENISSCHA